MAAKRGNSQPARRRAPSAGSKRKRRSGSRGKGHSRFQSFLWFTGGLVIGLAILLPVLLLTSERQQTADPQPSPEDTAPAEEATEPTTEEASRGQTSRSGESPEESPGEADSGYRFYTILPEMDATVPEAEPESGPPPDSARPTPEEPPQSEEPPSAEAPPSDPEAPSTDKSGRYLVQVSAFREPGPAEKLKARLAMQGLQARVVRADLGDKGIWHRVRLGPYAARAEAAKVQARLETKDMEAMILKK